MFLNPVHNSPLSASYLTSFKLPRKIRTIMVVNVSVLVVVDVKFFAGRNEGVPASLAECGRQVKHINVQLKDRNHLLEHITSLFCNLLRHLSPNPLIVPLPVKAGMDSSLSTIKHPHSLLTCPPTFQ